MLFSVIFILLRKKSRTTFTGNSTLKNQKSMNFIIKYSKPTNGESSHSLVKIPNK